jgi:hypothetical protein
MKSLFALLLTLSLTGCTFFLRNDDPNKAATNETKVRYRSPSHEELNSFESYFRKETQPAHYAQTKFDLNASQQLLILNRAFLAKFFNMPQFVGSTGSGADTCSLRIASGALDWTVRWTDSPEQLRSSGSKLPELLAYIDSTVHSTPEYRQLPKRQQ